jgi:hypothetical protein
MSSLAPEAASQRQDPPPPSVINVFVTLEDDGEMEWLTREGIPNLGQPGFLYEPHILVSLKGVYKSTHRISSNQGLGLGRILMDTVGSNFPATRRRGTVATRDPSGRKVRLPVDGLRFYTGSTPGGNPKVEFEEAHDGVNDAVATLSSLLGALLRSSEKTWNTTTTSPGKLP